MPSSSLTESEENDIIYESARVSISRDADQSLVSLDVSQESCFMFNEFHRKLLSLQEKSEQSDTETNSVLYQMKTISRKGRNRSPFVSFTALKILCAFAWNHIKQIRSIVLRKSSSVKWTGQRRYAETCFGRVILIITTKYASILIIRKIFRQMRPIHSSKSLTIHQKQLRTWKALNSYVSLVPFARNCKTCSRSCGSLAVNPTTEMTMTSSKLGTTKMQSSIISIMDRITSTALLTALHTSSRKSLRNEPQISPQNSGPSSSPLWISASPSSSRSSCSFIGKCILSHSTWSIAIRLIAQAKNKKARCCFPAMKGTLITHRSLSLFSLSASFSTASFAR